MQSEKSNRKVISHRQKFSSSRFTCRVSRNHFACVVSPPEHHGSAPIPLNICLDTVFFPGLGTWILYYVWPISKVWRVASRARHARPGRTSGRLDSDHQAQSYHLVLGPFACTHMFMILATYAVTWHAATRDSLLLVHWPIVTI